MFQIVLLAAVVTCTVAHGGQQQEVHHAPQPYSFGYNIKDKHGEQYRQESSDGHNSVKGSYGFTDDRGIRRQVDYVADKAGFRAQVKTNEPGTANQNPAAVQMISSADSYYGSGYGNIGYGQGLGNLITGYGYGNQGHGINVAGNSGIGHGISGSNYGASGSIRNDANLYNVPLGRGGYGDGVVSRYDSRYESH